MLLLQQKCNNNLLLRHEIGTQIILLLLCLTCYLGALNGNFVFDDTVAIVKNSGVTKVPTNYSAIFSNDFWGSPLQSSDSHKSFRPLTTLMFHMEYAQLGLQAKHMKSINLLLHCIITLLVWHLLRGFEFEQLPLNGEQVSTIAAALFAIHPVHTEAVCGIVSRAELMFALVYLLALLLTQHRSLHVPIASDMLILLLTTVGVLFKETAIIIPVACIFVDYIRSGIYTKSWRDQLYMFCNYRNLCYVSFTVILTLMRLKFQNFENPQFKAMDNPVAFANNTLTRLYSQSFLYVVNFWILLCPEWLSFDWALGCVELVTTIWDLRLQSVLALYSFMMVVLMNCKYSFGPMLGFGLMIIPFLPATGIIRVGFVIAERVLYVPSIGFCFLVAYAFVYIQNIRKERWFSLLMKSLLMLVFACFILRARQRAGDWLTEERLFESALKVCPKNAKVHYNIARLATDKAEREKAFYHYHKAIELYPHYESALMNLGNLYRETGDLNSAEQFIKTALEVLPSFPAAWMNLGIVQSARKKYTEALQSYENALKYRKNYAMCHYNMGNLYLEQKLYSEAMHHWQEAIALNPRQPKAWANLLTMLDNRGLYADALRLSAEALKHLPNETIIMFIRANVFGKLKHYIEAETLYKHVIAVEPFNILYHTNLGVLYHRWNKLDAAIASYQRALQIDTKKAKTAYQNLSKLLKRQNQEVQLKQMGNA